MLGLARLVALVLFSPFLFAFAAVMPAPPPVVDARASSFWMETIRRQGTVPFGSASSYQVFRNVRDFGAKGDGSTDDTDAINSAISAGSRCGQGCDSSTTTPAIVYFPAGTYVVSKPLIQLYYSQFIGDPTNVPVIKASPSFKGIAVIDSDPYDNSGNNWYTNQNNFFRQVRNFVIDISRMDPSSGAAIHWQVAQATSLENIVFNMAPASPTNKQQGIFMDNGSGGFMADLVFNGGNMGAFFGNQQFTTRNLTFNGCNTAVFMNWNWVWNLKSLKINNCGVGLNMSNGGASQTVGSVLLQDSTFTNTPTGVVTAFVPGGSATNGTLILDNVDFTGSKTAVADTSGNTVLAGGSKIANWAQGHAYTTGASASAAGPGAVNKTGPASQIFVRGPLGAPTKPATLLGADGKIFERTKPQYEAVPAANFVSVKSKGAKGDGVTDDTAAIQAVFNSAKPDQIVYFDHGAYLIKNTVKVPKQIKMTGEIWPLIMADGASFADQANPKPVFQVGQPGDKGAVEMSDLIFETKGPAPGAILMEWNLAGSAAGAAGMWDVHFRIGGSAGTGIQSDTCSKNEKVTAPANPACIGAFMLMHVTKQASLYMENNWLWVADHELDRPDHNQINVFNGRGLLIESSTGPNWLYGTSSEHSQLFNYQLVGAKNIYMGVIQTETPYWQSNPNALSPFAPNAKFSDPTFENCTTNSCRKAWGLRIMSSSNILVYGAGLYSFFDNWNQECAAKGNCQDNMVSLENCSADVYLAALSTKAATNMVTVNGQTAARRVDNVNNFCDTIAVFETA